MLFKSIKDSGTRPLGTALPGSLAGLHAPGGQRARDSARMCKLMGNTKGQPLAAAKVCLMQHVRYIQRWPRRGALKTQPAYVKKTIREGVSEGPHQRAFAQIKRREALCRGSIACCWGGE